jgi:rod shape-determining protein MreC
MALYRRTRSTRLLVVTLVLASLITITVDYRGGHGGPFEVAGRATQTVVSALQGAVSTVLRPVGSFFSGLAHIGSLQSTNKRLQARIQQLEQQQAHNISLERQNAELLALLKLQNALGMKGVAAVVIGQTVGNFEWAITINRGSSDGVKVDAPVVSGDGLVGHVVEVAPNSSIIQLVIDPDSAVAGRLSGSGQTGLIVGERNQDLQMQLVSPDAKVSPSEQIVTAGYMVPGQGQGSLYPPEIVIGTVSHVYQQNGGLTKIVAVRPAVDFSSLETVLVLTGPKK